MTDQTVKLPELQPFPVIPEKLGHRALWIAWAQEYARQAVLEERERCANAAKEAEIRRVSIAMKMPRRRPTSP